jgi:hypothetical protein
VDLQVDWRSNSKVPQALTIKAEYSQSGGMKIISLSGGDPMETKDINSASSLINELKMQRLGISDSEKIHLFFRNSNFWVNPTTGTYNVGTFKAGDRVEISPTNCSGAVLQPEVWN